MQINNSIQKPLHYNSLVIQIINIEGFYFFRGIWIFYKSFRMASLVAQLIKNLPVMLQTWVRSLDQENPQEKEMATHSSIFAWRIPWTEEPDELQSMESQRVGHDWVSNFTSAFKITSKIMEKTHICHTKLTDIKVQKRRKIL